MKKEIMQKYNSIWVILWVALALISEEMIYKSKIKKSRSGSLPLSASHPNVR